MPRTTKRAVGSSGRGPRIEGHGRLKDAGSTRSGGGSSSGDAEEFERQVLVAMERARSLAGLTVEQMARRLRPAVRMEDVEAERRARHLWYAWRRSPRAIPATALLAAAEAAGTSVAELLMEPGAASDVQRQVADPRQQMAELRHDVSDRSVEDFQERATSAFRRAMRLVNAEGNASAFWRRMQEVASGRGLSQRSVARWAQGSEFPAWALVIAAEAAGTSFAELLMDPDTVSDLQYQVADLRQQMAELGHLAEAESELRRRLAEHEREIADLREAIADTAAATRPTSGSSASGRWESS